jgi:nucleotide-binding universal stress UspA family protein
MHVLIATDGSKQSLVAARYFKSFADPGQVDRITLVAVVRPLAAVAFADDLSLDKQEAKTQATSFREAAQTALDVIAEEFTGWGPKVTKKIRSGSPANEIIKAAGDLDAGLVVVASGSRGLSEAVLVGSTAQRVQHYAPCPVLVVRPAPKRKAPRQARTAKKTTTRAAKEPLS